jgi:hypothetical protein
MTIDEIEQLVHASPTEPNLFAETVCKIPKVGHVFEFGVYKGTSLTEIARLIGPDRKVYGFDSFEGLPEDWRPITEEAGAFKCDPPTDLPPNAELVIGLFRESLPRFMVHNESKVAFAHIDCDLYSSTKSVLDVLQNDFFDGSILVFDELIDYIGYEQHEIKALSEFLSDTGFRVECIGRHHGMSAIFRLQVK